MSRWTDRMVLDKYQRAFLRQYKSLGVSEVEIVQRMTHPAPGDDGYRLFRQKLMREDAKREILRRASEKRAEAQRAEHALMLQSVKSDGDDTKARNRVAAMYPRVFQKNKIEPTDKGV